MIEKLIELSIRHRLLVLILSGAVAVVGVYNALHLSIDALPDVTNVQVSVVTKSAGLSPAEVEKFVTYPIELALNGMPSVTQIRSISRTGVSSVTVVFRDDVDVYFARHMVSERLRLAEAEIPEGYGRPELSPVATALGDIYEMVLVSDRHSPEELRTYLEWELAPQLRAVSGVVDINVFGGQLKQYHVLLEPARLVGHKLGLRAVLDTLRESNVNVGGGYIQKGQEMVVIRGEGQFRSLKDIENLAVKTNPDGTPVLLRQIAEVRKGSALRFGAVTRSGQGEVVGMTVMMLKGENSRTVVAAVKAKVDELRARLPAGMEIQSFYDRSEFIERTLKTVFKNLSKGAGLVILILLVALGSLKGALLVGAAIPFAMLLTVIWMRQLGIVGNLMSLGAIDFGLLVDGAVVMLESVLAVFALESVRAKGAADTVDLIRNGCTKVGRAATFSVTIIILVYLPLMTLEGTEGKMFQPMAVTVALAIAMALLFSLTTFPAALAYLYREPHVHHSKYWDKIIAAYEKALRTVRGNPRRAFLTAIGFFAVALVLGATLGSEFIPRIDEGELLVDIKRLPSIAIDYSRDLNQQIEEVLRKNFPEVKSIVSRTGRGESAAEPIGTEEGEVMVKVGDKSEWTSAHDLDELMEKMKAKILEHVPATYFSMSQPIEDRVNELIAGSRADVVVRIFGEDLLKLKAIADDFGRVLRDVPGTGDLRVQRVLGLSMLEVRLNRENLGRYHVSADEVLKSIEALRVGIGTGRVFEGFKSFDIVVRLAVDASSLTAVRDLPVMTESGGSVPLSLVATVQATEGPAAIYRDALQRRVMVEVNVRGRDIVSYVREAQEKTAALAKALPEGYRVSWGGQFENFNRAKTRLALVVPVIVLIIFGMLMAAFSSFRLALAVFVLVPLSIGGGLVGLFVCGLPFSIPAAVGFIALSGITVLTGVVYVGELKRLLETSVPLEEAVIGAAVNTGRAVITTEVIAAIGFIPMALSHGAGAEVQRPLAIVVVFGLLTGGVLGQLLLPLLVERLSQWKVPSRRSERHV